MSGAQTSTAPNILFNAPAALGAAQTYQSNQLMQQQRQQEISAADMEQVSRAANWLQTLDSSQRPAAYKAAIQQLQGMGYAKNAPPEYPGDEQNAMLARQSLPVQQQYSLGLTTSPLMDQLLKEGQQLFGGNQPSSGGGGGGGAAPALTGDLETDRKIIAQRESGGDPTALNYVAKADPTAYARGATASGKYQFVNSTWQDGLKLAGLDPSKYPTAMSAPESVQDQVFTAVYKRDGTKPWDASTYTQNWVPTPSGRFVLAHRAPPGSAQPATAPPGVQMGGAAPAPPGGSAGPYPATGGGIGAVLGTQPVVGGTPPGTQPVASNADIMMGGVRQAQATLLPGTMVAGPSMVASTTPAAGPSVEAKPEPGWGTTVGTYGPQSAAPAAPPVVTAQTGPGPAPVASGGPATGVNSPQFQQATALQNYATKLELALPNDPRARALAAAARARAQMLLQVDSTSVNPQTGVQTSVLTGKQSDAAKPAEHWTQNPNGTLTNAATGEVKSAPTPAAVWVEKPDGTYVNQATGEPKSAVTPQELWIKNADGTFTNVNTGKPMALPLGRPVSTPGGVVLQPKPGGGVEVVYKTSPEDVAAQEYAKTAAAAAGGAAGKLVGTLADQGRSSGQAIGNIDYGVSQIQKAKAGGINTGYFAPWLSTASAALKSLGLEGALGVDPSAVGNIQTAQKTLAVVSGAILNQILGPESQVTDAKIQHFIHAQPGIETDPDALGRVLNWARSQFVYEREMSAAAMKDAKATGTLPPGWQADYYDKHGFAPIYNPASGEMQQPDGQAAPRQPPASIPTAPVNPAARTAGTTYNTPKGPMKWDGKLWQPPGQ